MSENNGTSTNGRVKFGACSWDDVPPKFNNDRQSQQSDFPKLDFMRLVTGKNVVRIVSAPYKYISHKIKVTANEKGFGKRIYCSKPLHDKCPICEKGHKAKPRYVAVVIDRADNTLKLLDMSTVIYNQLHALKDDIEFGDPSGYDINIRMNPEAGAAGYYTVLPRQKAPLSEEDVALVNTLGKETIEKILTRRVSPPTPDQVLARIEKLGGSIDSLPPPPEPAKKASTTEGKGNLTEANDEDYSFDQTAN